MTKTKKTDTKQNECVTPDFEHLIFENMGDFKTSLVKAKLKDDDLKKLIQRLLIEWAQGRVNL